MRHPGNRIRRACSGACLTAALLLWPCGLLLAQPASAPRAPRALAQADPAAMRDYQRKLEEYTRARQDFNEEASVYWNAITEKRRARIAKRRNREAIALDDYVLTQPPVYSGPRRPVDPSGETPEE